MGCCTSSYPVVASQLGALLPTVRVGGAPRSLQKLHWLLKERTTSSSSQLSGLNSSAGACHHGPHHCRRTFGRHKTGFGLMRRSRASDAVQLKASVTTSSRGSFVGHVLGGIQSKSGIRSFDRIPYASKIVVERPGEVAEGPVHRAH
jgi:hypothetical protein